VKERETERETERERENRRDAIIRDTTRCSGHFRNSKGNGCRKPLHCFI